MFKLSLTSLFTEPSRRFLQELSVKAKLEHRDERQELEVVVGSLLDDVNREALVAPEAVREVLGCDVRAEVEVESKRRWFTPVATQHTLKDYVKRISEAITFFLLLIEPVNRSKASIELDEATLCALQMFKNSGMGKADVIRFILSLLEGNRSIRSKYNSELLCLYPITQLITQTNTLSCSETAQKSVSSLKYLCRGCALLKIASTTANVPLTEMSVVKNLMYYTGATHAFACLFRLHKGICSLSTSVKERAVLYAEDDMENLFIDGVDFSPRLLSKTFQTLFAESKKIPQVPDDVETQAGARRLLDSCLRYEKSALVLMHLLMGASSRATDYKSLTFASGGPELPSNMSVVNSELIFFRREARKNSLLRRVKVSSPAVVPIRYFDHVLHYWEKVRPVCAKAATLLKKKSGEVARWTRYCFVKGNATMIRKIVNEKLEMEHGTCAGFQRLRHASEALFRNVIAPQELQVRQRYDYDSLFGHSYRTGLSYGVLKLLGTGSRQTPEDISSVVRCLKGFWKLLTRGVEFSKDEPKAVGSQDDELQSECDESDTSDEEDDLVCEEACEEQSIHSNGESTTFEQITEQETAADQIIDDDNILKGNEVAVDVGDDDNVLRGKVVAVDVGDDDNVLRGKEVPVDVGDDDNVLRGKEVPVDVGVSIKALGFTEFSCAGQQKLLEAVSKNENSVIGVLPTGGGKTLSILFALTESFGVTLAVYPLKSVYDDALMTLQRDYLEFQWCTWDPSAGLLNLTRNAKLLLVTAEQAKSKLFLAQLRAKQDLFRRVVFDEAPVFVSQRFRIGLGSLPLVIRANCACPFVLLTATLKPCAEENLKSAFHCHGALVIRAPTVRDNIEHYVVSSRKPRDEIGNHVNPNHGLTIVFVRDMKELQVTAKFLERLNPRRTVTYHGSMNHEERRISASEWKSARKPVMIATTAFAFGINSPNCNTVVHVDVPYDICSYVQAAGRSGRKGQLAKSIILHRGNRLGQSEIGQFMRSKSCRQSSLSSLLDAKELRWTQTCGRCDRCRMNGSVVHRVPEVWRRNSFTARKAVARPCEERAAASLELAKVKKIIKFFLGLKWCTSCYLKSRGREKKQHALGSCPWWRYRCFRCGFLGCKRQQCTRQAFISKTMLEANLCVSCSLPPYLIDVNIHKGEFSMGRRCKYADTILPSMLLLFHLEKEGVESYAGKRFHTFEEYLSWCLDCGTTGLPAFLRFAYCCSD